MKTAFLFPGQGAQVVGMGSDIAQAFPVAAETFEKANDILGFDLRRICFEGPAEELNTTTISQPAIFTTSAAILEVIRTEPGSMFLKPDVTAGLSLGEYTALYAAGLISFEDTIALVHKRGQAMQQAADANNGGMVSIIGLDEAKLVELCTEAAGHELLEPVNFNCPGQTVLSGDKGPCGRAQELATEYGAIAALPLEVAGAFHTELMASAADTLELALLDCHIGQPGAMRTIANVDAAYYRSAEEIAQGLAKQLTRPILWQKSMERLLADGVENFYEIGPSRVLTGLMRRINRKTKVTSVSSLQAVNDVVGL